MQQVIIAQKWMTQYAIWIVVLLQFPGAWFQLYASEYKKSFSTYFGGHLYLFRAQYRGIQ